MGYKASNNADTTLSESITTTSTAINVATGHGDDFPALGATDWTLITITDKNGAREIIKIIARTGDTMTVGTTPGGEADVGGRAQEGTAALSITYTDDHSVRCCPTAGLIEAMADYSDQGDLTATPAELSELHESGIMKADLEKLHAITASAVNINALTALLDADNRTVGDIITKTSAGTMGAIAAVAVGSYLKSAGVGELPAWGKMSLGDTGVAVDNFTFTSTGSLSITGVGFKPSLVIFFGVYEDTLSFGVSTASKSRSVRIVLGTDNATRSSSYCFSLGDNIGIADVIATLTSMDSDGFTLNVSKVSGTANVSYIAFP
jgi:hypothetical protein